MKINNLKQVGKVELSSVYGGQTRITTSLTGKDEKNPKYTDVHVDNDDDGIWSSGDVFIITAS